MDRPSDQVTRGRVVRRVAIVATSCLALLGLQVGPAAAAVTCASSIGTVTLTAGGANDAAGLKVGALGQILFATGTAGSYPAAPTLGSYTQCGGITGATTLTTNLIKVVAAPGGINSHIVIDLSGGSFGPGLTLEAGSSDEIEFNVSLGGDAGDSLFIEGRATADNIGWGVASTNVCPSTTIGSNNVASGVNLNAGETDGIDCDLSLSGATNATVVDGGGGADILSGAGGGVFDSGLYGSALDLRGDAGDDALTGGKAIDILAGGDDDDTVTGGLVGSVLPEDLVGGDILNGGLHGTKGDTLSYSASASAVTVNLATATAVSQVTDTLQSQAGDAGSSFENIAGSPLADSLTGDAEMNMIDGAAGNDTALAGGAGDDEIAGAAGTDVLSAGAGDDDLSGGDGADTLDGGSGYDTLAGDAGGDTVTDGDGDPDTLNYSSSPSAVTVNIAANSASGGDAAGDAITGTFQTLVGSFTQGAGDMLTGNGLNNVLIGGAGDDTIAGAGGDDSLIGGSGADTFNGGDGADSISPGNDGAADVVRGGDAFTDTSLKDLVSYAPCGSPVILDLSSAIPALVGCATGDVFSGIEQIRGSGQADVLTGNSAANYITGGAGVDTINAGAGDDLVQGGRGADIVYGQGDNDTLFGGPANDLLTGGGGTDHADGEEDIDTCVATFIVNCEE